MPDSPSLRPTGELLELVTTCPLCDGSTMDPGWARLETTTLRDLVSALGDHYADAHPDDVGRFMSTAESVGVLRPPPQM